MFASISNHNEGLMSFIRSFTKKTMKERMISGDYFTGADPSIRKEMMKAFGICHKYNEISPEDREGKLAVLK